MATIINNPDPGRDMEEPRSSFGIVIVILLALILIGLFYFYGRPSAWRSNNGTSARDVQIETPSRLEGSVDINTQTQ